jgi:hypothetical protein
MFAITTSPLWSAKSAIFYCLSLYCLCALRSVRFIDSSPFLKKR